MSNIAVKDADGITRYKKAGGDGTDLDPYVEVQDVRIQDQTTPQIGLFLADHIDIGLTFRSPVAEDVETVEVTTTGSVPETGMFLCIKENDFFTQMEILAVTPISGDDYDLGIAIPMDHEYTTGANVCLQSVDMNVDGSTTPVEFFLSSGGTTAGTEWDITRILISMTHEIAGDDGLFGGIPKLLTGVYHRVEDGTNYNIFNARENADLAIQGYDITYPNRSGKEGVFGTRSRITINGQDKRGVVFRLVGDTGDKFVACVRDDLTGLASYRTMLQGQVVQP